MERTEGGISLGCLFHYDRKGREGVGTDADTLVTSGRILKFSPDGSYFLCEGGGEGNSWQWVRGQSGGKYEESGRSLKLSLGKRKRRVIWKQKGSGEVKGSYLFHFFFVHYTQEWTFVLWKHVKRVQNGWSQRMWRSWAWPSLGPLRTMSTNASHPFWSQLWSQLSSSTPWLGVRRGLLIEPQQGL